MSFLQVLQRRPITAAHHFPNSMRTGNGMSSLPLNGRWNTPPSSFIGPPPHLQQQQQQSPWNAPSMSHGFPSTSYVFSCNQYRSMDKCFRSRRPIPSMNNNPLSTGKDHGNPFSFLPSTNPNGHPMRRPPMMNNGQFNGDLGQNFPSLNVKIDRSNSVSFIVSSRFSEWRPVRYEFIQSIGRYDAQCFE